MQKQTKKRSSIIKLSHAQLESLEKRQLMAGDTAAALPFRLDFDQNIANTVFDKDGQGTGFTRLQANKFGSEYQQNLIDIDVNQGVLRLTTTGTASAGSNAGSDNTQINALETQFNGSTSGFTVNARLLGPLGYLSDAYEQAGIYFGPDQDNYVKLVAIKTPDGQSLQFKDEINGSGTLSDNLTRFNIGNFASINTLDVRLVGDAATGRVTAFYSVNGGDFTKLSLEYTIASNKRTAFFNGGSRAGLITSQKNNLAPITATFDSFEITAGSSVTLQPSITDTRPGNNAIDVARNSFIAADLYLPNVGGGVDSSTLNSNNVRLYRFSDGAPVAGSANTTGGGDAIVFSPTGLLDANTKYVFEITAGVKDTTGQSFTPYTSSFTTGISGVQADTSIAFDKVAQTATAGKRYTSLAIGPDHKMYATTIEGQIVRYNIGTDGALSAAQIINTITVKEGNKRSMTGIVFDPASTANNLIAYVTHGDFAGIELKEYSGLYKTAAANWSGKITKLTGSDLQNAQDVVVGLPRSVKDHQTYQMAFGPDGMLYVSQGAQSAMGAPDNAWGQRSEELMSAAVLRVNVGQIGSSTINVQTAGVTTPYNPYAQNAPVQLYATGVRSAFDLLFHSNGHLYSGVNGSAAGGNTPANPAIAGTALTNVATQRDRLIDIVNGGYYGHPDVLRNQYIIDGGNPTSGIDANEILPDDNHPAAYPVGTQPESSYKGVAYDFGYNQSPNGLIEYKGQALGGKLDKKIIVVRFSGGDDLAFLSVAPNGTISDAQTGYAGTTGFVNPLDLVEDPATGFIYVAEFGDQAAVPGSAARITLLKPNAGAVAGIATVSRSAVYLSDATNTPARSKPQTVRLINTGTGPLVMSGISFSGANAGEFSATDALGQPVSTPRTLAAGERVDIYVSFKATTTGIRSATLNLATDAGNKFVTLRALGTAGAGGNLEPSLQRILDLYQIGVNVGDSTPDTTDFPVDTAYSADEVTMPRLIKSGNNAVTVELLGTFANQVSKTTFGWYEAGNFQTKNPLAAVAASDGQAVAPLDDGSVTFDPGSGAFSIYGNFTLGSTNNPLNRDVYSENVLNTWETNTSRQKKIRFYKLRDDAGNLVPNAYVFAMEEYNLSFDQNDMVGIIRNVQPAAEGPEIGVENRDNLPTADRLVMSRIRETNTVNPNFVHDLSIVRVRNTGSQPLNISSMTINNTDFVIEDVRNSSGAVVTGPITLAGNDGNAFVDVKVRFVYNDPSSLGNKLRTAVLTINSNDSDEAAKQVTLAGLWQSHSENQPNGKSAEPVAQTVVDAFGYKIKLTNSNQSIDTHGTYTAVGEEVLTELFQRADPGLRVDVRMLAAYHQQSNPLYPTTNSSLNVFAPDIISSSTGKPTLTRLFKHNNSDGQTLLPRLENSTTALATVSFIPPAATFGFNIDGGGGTYSQRQYNTPNDAVNDGHGWRFYAAKDANGKIIPDTYVAIQDYVKVSYANYDYQDNMFLVSNVKPLLGPSAAATPTASATGSGITLNWAASAEGNVTAYNVYRSNAANGTYTLVNTTAASDRTYADTSAPAGATSYYTIAAVDYHGTVGTQSGVVSATRGGVITTVPAAPSNATATAASPTTVAVNWQDNSTDETGFRIDRRAGTGAWSTLANVNAGVVSFTDNAAAAGTSYGYRVVAINANGSSAASNEATVTTPTVQPPQSTALTSTDIGRPTPAGSVGTLVDGRDYDVSVGGTDIWGKADSFNFVYTQKTGDFDVSVRITGLNGTDANSMAGLMVRDSVAEGSRQLMLKARQSDYRLTYRTSTNGASTATGSAVVTFPDAYLRLQRIGNTLNTYTSTDGANWVAFSSTTLTLNSTVLVGMATSSHSNSAATTAMYRGFGDTVIGQPAPAPTAASGLTATAASSNRVNLTWADNANNETGYRVERQTGTGAWQSVATLPANSVSFADTTVAASTSYTYRVFATAAVDSPTSNTATVTTPAAQPGSNVTLTSIADTYVRDGADANKNFGGESSIVVKDSTTTGFRRHGYTEFNISSLTTASTAKLRVLTSLNTGNPVQMAIYGVSSSTWNETTVTWNTRPVVGNVLSTATISTGDAQWVEIDVSAYVQQAIAAGKTSISFNFQATASSTGYISIASRESGSGPQLVIGSNTQPPAATKPAAANNLVATAASSTSVSLTWTDNSTNETGFRIERKNVGGTFATVGSVAVNATSYSDTSAAPGGSYVYRIIAFNTLDADPSNEYGVVTPTGGTTVTPTTLNATADTFVKDGSNADNTFGTAASIEIKASSTTGYNREGYVEFNLSQVTSLNSAKLRLNATLNTGSPVTVGVNSVSSASWDENTVTWNTRPVVGSQLGTFTVTGRDPQFFEVDLTQYVQAAIAAGKTSVSVNLRATAPSSGFVSITSHESGTAPQLVIA